MLMLTDDQRRTDFAVTAGLPVLFSASGAWMSLLDNRWGALLFLLISVTITFQVGYLLYEGQRQGVATTRWHRAAYRMIPHRSRVAPLDPDGRPKPPRSPSPVGSFLTWTALALPSTLLGTGLLVFDRPWPALGLFIIGELAAFPVGYLLYGDLRRNGLTTKWRRAARHMFDLDHKALLSPPKDHG